MNAALRHRTTNILTFAFVWENFFQCSFFIVISQFYRLYFDVLPLIFRVVTGLMVHLVPVLRVTFFFFERHTVNDCLKFILVSNARVTAATQWKEPSFEWEHLQ